MDSSSFPIDFVVTTTCILLLFYFLRQLKAFKHRSHKLINTPPEAGGAWPIIGHLHKLHGPKLPHIVLSEMADKYGPIYTIRLGLHEYIVVSNCELIKDLFTTHDKAVSSRPKMIAAQHLGYDNAMFAFAPYGTFWRAMRKIVSLELLCSRRLELLKHVHVYETKTSIQELHKLWRERNISHELDKVKVNMSQCFSNLTLNVTLQMIAGKRYIGTMMEGREKDEEKRCQRIFREFFCLTGINMVSDAIPWFRWLDLGGYEKAMKKTGKEMDDLVEEWLQEHLHRRSCGESKEDKNSDQDFMDVMISTLENENGDMGGFDANTINKATCLNMIIGGTDTTSTILTWTLSLLMNNPHKLRKAKEEIDVEVGMKRQVEESDIPKLVYLQATIKETLRLYSPGPLGGIRELSQDLKIGGYHVPKGTRLITHIWKLQRDPKVWSDPSEFRPERFLTTQKEIDVRGQHFELIPFGVGRRICPGINLGMQIIHFVIATFLQGFEISTLNNEPVDMSEISGLSNTKALPLELLITPRLPPNLYE
ncbi:LOW QUALITY PROTEIN: cytochrome P450 CYP82D47-like [Impatiens glandulifera]|uniref:LOW QUALITY PROTEIN: cytochrome P450 CYP82D47-like n=1 Tax=Impatiens glandulifera TaxID=253017 RepID=UPI001FB10ABE|nr:LOW QUALITY PROTEIN: cytochrome P450 CYP82D47-like [Impatiens glandulifera]